MTDKTCPDCDAADLEIARLKAELEAFKEERAMGPVVVRTETPTAAMKELERLCNEARDLADVNAAKHAKAKKCWMEALDAVQEARSERDSLRVSFIDVVRQRDTIRRLLGEVLPYAKLFWRSGEQPAACISESLAILGTPSKIADLIGALERPEE